MDTINAINMRKIALEERDPLIGALNSILKMIEEHARSGQFVLTVTLREKHSDRDGSCVEEIYSKSTLDGVIQRLIERGFAVVKRKNTMTIAW
jgi:hypothetical protein